MKRQAILSLLAVVAAAVVAPAGFAQTASSPSILFARMSVLADGNTYAGLFRVKPSGENVVPLISPTIGVNASWPRWSPGGSAIVFEQSHADRTDRSQLFVMDRQGGSLRRITSGAYHHQAPSWGPGIIGYIADRGNHNLCLAVVHADGTGQRDVFCPHVQNKPNRPMRLWIRRWIDSQNLYLEAQAFSYDRGAVSHIYRVNVATGAAVKVGKFDIGQLTEMDLSPDGSRAVYDYAGAVDSRIWARGIQIADLNANTLTWAFQGYTAKFSPDGTKIAFSRGWQVYLMNPDGSDVQPVLADPDPNAGYQVMDWSWDGTRLLLHKGIRTTNQSMMQIVDIATGAARDVEEGSAAPDGWYHQ